MTEPGRKHESPLENEARTVAHGRAARTPFVLLGGVAVAVWTLAGAIVLAGMLVWWLV